MYVVGGLGVDDAPELVVLEAVLVHLDAVLLLALVEGDHLACLQLLDLVVSVFYLPHYPELVAGVLLFDGFEVEFGAQGEAAFGFFVLDAVDHPLLKVFNLLNHFAMVYKSQESNTENVLNMDAPSHTRNPRFRARIFLRSSSDSYTFQL